MNFCSEIIEIKENSLIFYLRSWKSCGLTIGCKIVRFIDINNGIIESDILNDGRIINHNFIATFISASFIFCNTTKFCACKKFGIVEYLMQYFFFSSKNESPPSDREIFIISRLIESSLNIFPFLSHLI